MGSAVVPLGLLRPAVLLFGLRRLLGGRGGVGAGVGRVAYGFGAEEGVQGRVRVDGHGCLSSVLGSLLLVVMGGRSARGGAGLSAAEDDGAWGGEGEGEADVRGPGVAWSGVAWPCGWGGARGGAFRGYAERAVGAVLVGLAGGLGGDGRGWGGGGFCGGRGARGGEDGAEEGQKDEGSPEPRGTA